MGNAYKDNWLDTNFKSGDRHFSAAEPSKHILERDLDIVVIQGTTWGGFPASLRLNERNPTGCKTVTSF